MECKQTKSSWQIAAHRQEVTTLIWGLMNCEMGWGEGGLPHGARQVHPRGDSRASAVFSRFSTTLLGLVNWTLPVGKQLEFSNRLYNYAPAGCEALCPRGCRDARPAGLRSVSTSGAGHCSPSVRLRRIPGGPQPASSKASEMMGLGIVGGFKVRHSVWV